MTRGAGVPNIRPVRGFNYRQSGENTGRLFVAACELSGRAEFGAQPANDSGGRVETVISLTAVELGVKRV